MNLFSRIDDFFYQLKQTIVFSKISLRFTYHELHIKEEDIYKTTFQNMYEHYDFFVVPSSLTNAPSMLI